ncbi:MAG: GNAT family N-acetyltransferase [Bacteroidales bacterium]|nr:GNAT family N-acetyltransferase [Bacteroidales bacterium]
MEITEREITQSELKHIYDDFKKIKIQDGIPQCEQVRYQYLAEENGEIIGFVSGLTNHKWFHLTDLWVKESLRRQGLGAKLLQMLEDKIVVMGIEHIYTWASGFINPQFYESRGYSVFTIFEDFFEVKGYNFVGYRKDLK